MWRQCVLKAAAGNPNVKLNPPADNSDILAAERALGIRFPSDLVEMLRQVDGDNYFLLSCRQIVDVNLRLRSVTAWMPLDCLLFVAGNGCGDYFGYPITGDGVKETEIFMWEHEYDNRIFKANGLREAVENYYKDTI
ncbi:MAG: SMI1/KNR4 family protein [Firmicutes bacterium]|nr:SMI1/KNR4 family protein [Dethiobacter sp.]MBS3889744.1 SMI1/KNR4 family protein [Bacillota bacterium]MBS4053401.1 SMI1/KNR4 family protein [Thermaerobacter sp.]